MLLRMLAIERASHTTGIKQRQIYVTQSRVLALRFKERFEDLLLASAQVTNSDKDLGLLAETESRRLLDYDDEDDSKDGLPLSFNALTDNHFPLFISFDKVCFFVPNAWLVIEYRRLAMYDARARLWVVPPKRGDHDV